VSPTVSHDSHWPRQSRILMTHFDVPDLLTGDNHDDDDDDDVGPSYW
jgi:hypothetical protein